jgi:hypothetical protein
MGTELLDQVAAAKAAIVPQVLLAREELLAKTIANGVQIDGVPIWRPHVRVGGADYWIATLSNAPGTLVLIRNDAVLTPGFGWFSEPEAPRVERGRFARPVHRAGWNEWRTFGAEVDAVAQAFQKAIDLYRDFGELVG